MQCAHDLYHNAFVFLGTLADMHRTLVKPLILSLTLACMAALNGCATREVHEQYSGSTAQRLVTYSIQKLAKNLTSKDFEHMRGKNVFMKSHFIVENQDLTYAHDYLSLEFRRRFGINMVSETEADYIFDLFFSSLGTDQDTYGLTVPLINLSDTSQSVNIDLLAVDMYHGITEARLFITDVETKAIVSRKKMLARVRTDKFSTPIFSFPVSSLDD